MKILFFLLALANVVFFMWEFHKGGLSFGAKPAENGAAYQEQILLLSEADSATSTSVPKNPETTAVDQPEINAVSCFEAGPFTSERDYKAWENRLGRFIQPVKRDEQVVSDYLVYYPAAQTQEQSKANLQQLKDKGLTDLWLLDQGTEQGQISLGVFDREEQAISMKNELFAKGINAEVRARYKSATQKFAVIKGESNVMDNLEVLKKAYPNVKVKKLDGSETDDCR